MEQAGILRSVAMAISGHKREDVYRRYDIVNDRDIQAAAARLEQRMREHVPQAKSAKPNHNAPHS